MAMIDDQGFRANVAMALLNPQGLIWIGHRADNGGWQLPQGGIEQDETPEDALWRELHEELGLRPEHAAILGRTKDPISYIIPPHLRRRKEARPVIGQLQTWFLLRFLGRDEDIRLDAGNEIEFDAYTWVPYERPIELVAPFKRDAYRRALAELAIHRGPKPPLPSV